MNLKGQEISPCGSQFHFQGNKSLCFKKRCDFLFLPTFFGIWAETLEAGGGRRSAFPDFFTFFCEFLAVRNFASTLSHPLPPSFPPLYYVVYLINQSINHLQSIEKYKKTKNKYMKNTGKFSEIIRACHLHIIHYMLVKDPQGTKEIFIRFRI